MLTWRMIVPQYWAEARLQKRTPGRQVTIRRFGWSDVSEAEAQALATARAEEALTRILAGDDAIQRRDRKVAYNGADGVPIREEILSRHGGTIITRNSYGAQCLNTPNVLFADVDVSTSPALRLSMVWGLVLLLVAVATGFVRFATRPVDVGTLVLCLLYFSMAVFLCHQVLKLLLRLTGGPKPWALRRIKRFAKAHADWTLRIYETPAGYRVLVLHAVFDPTSEVTNACFKQLRTDVVYRRMCARQRCFRARLTPKPWRIGLERLRPRPGIWPINPLKLAERQQWVTRYENTSRSFVACRFIEQLGNAPAHPEALAVQVLHDELCRADADLPLA